MLKTSAMWIDDANVSNCMACNAGFSLLLRKVLFYDSSFSFLLYFNGVFLSASLPNLSQSVLLLLLQQLDRIQQQVICQFFVVDIFSSKYNNQITTS